MAMGCLASQAVFCKGDRVKVEVGVDVGGGRRGFIALPRVTGC